MEDEEKVSRFIARGLESERFTVDDASDGTFNEAGKVGLWTKADSVTHFADFRVISKFE